ncbi:crotonase [Candidatus Bathyarchaeota archaeon]|nr:MAG: crotonase [Candidatus Bathyarchaeota archaeon]
MGEEKPVLVKVEDGVCWISLNRPSKLNSIVPEMLDLIGEALDRAETDPSIRCVVITGVGDRAFCAGADVSFLSGLSSSEAEAVSRKGHQTFMKILRLPKPVVAAVNGYALGGGCELAAACDFRIASEKARFGQPEINLGLVPGWGGTQLLPRLIGVAKAKEMTMTGAMLSAEEALRAGLVNRVVAADRFEEEVKAFAATLVKGPPLALAKAKRLVNMSLAMKAGLDAEAEAFGRLFSTGDFKEGVAAFKEKRKPEFKGE